MSNVFIRNIEGSSKDELPKDKSWIGLYEMVQEKPKVCPVCGKNKPLEGAHVQRRGSLYEKMVFIAPLCKGCNNPHNTEWMSIDADYLLNRNLLLLHMMPDDGETISFELK